MRVRNEEIIFPVTMVGSYPRPNWMSGKVFGEFGEPDYISYRTKEDYEPPRVRWRLRCFGLRHDYRMVLAS
jgi:hypothetical protein